MRYISLKDERGFLNRCWSVCRSRQRQSAGGLPLTGRPFQVDQRAVSGLIAGGQEPIRGLITRTKVNDMTQEANASGEMAAQHVFGGIDPEGPAG